jgi:hypothetical protein
VEVKNQFGSVMKRKGVTRVNDGKFAIEYEIEDFYGVPPGATNPPIILGNI